MQTNNPLEYSTFASENKNKKVFNKHLEFQWINNIINLKNHEMMKEDTS